MTDDWYVIPDTNGRYEITRTGDVRSLMSERVMKVWISNRGYRVVGLRPETGKQVKANVHRLLAATFIPNPENLPFVRHLNDIRLDNRLENLAWGTNSDNIADRIRNYGPVDHHPNKLQCLHGHDYTPENIRYQKSATGVSRYCKLCARDRSKARYAKRAAGSTSTESEPRGTE